MTKLETTRSMAPERSRIGAQPETVAEAVEVYIQHYEQLVSIGQRSPSTIPTITHHLDDLIRLLGKNAWLSSITPQRLDELVIEYAKLPDRRYSEYRQQQRAQERHDKAQVRSIYTQQGFMAVVRGFLGYAYKQDWIAADPTQKMTIKVSVKAGAPVDPKRKALAFEQAQALLEVGPGTAPEASAPVREVFVYTRDRVILHLLTLLGLRISEIGKLNFADLNRNGHELTLHIIGKGNVERYTPVPEGVIGMWDEYISARDKYICTKNLDATIPAVFISTRGNRLTNLALQRLVNEASKRVLADPERSHLYRAITPHALRHTAATLLLSSGWDLKVVSKMLGHSNVSVTSRYLDLLDDELEAAVNAHPLLTSPLRP